MADTIKKLSPSQMAEKFNIRLADGQRTQLAVNAIRHGRSMNQEAVEGLDWYMNKQALMDTMLDAIQNELGRLQQLEGTPQHLHNLDTLARDYPNTAHLVHLIKACMDEGPKASLRDGTTD